MTEDSFCVAILIVAIIFFFLGYLSKGPKKKPLKSGFKCPWLQGAPDISGWYWILLKGEREPRLMNLEHNEWGFTDRLAIRDQGGIAYHLPLDVPETPELR